MSKGISTRWCLGGLLVFGVGGAVAAPLGLAYDYGSDFVESFDGMGTGGRAPGDGDGTYWSVIGNGTEYAESLSVALDDDGDWGGTSNTAYNGGEETSSDDRHLAIYRGATGETSNMTARFRNATGAELDEIELLYDLEGAWVRYTPDERALSVSFVVQFSTDNATWTEMSGFGAGVDNSFTASATTWLSDAEIDGQSLSVRAVGGTFTPVAAIPVGGEFYIRWSTAGLAGGRLINLGIDNLRVPDTPQPEAPFMITSISFERDTTTGLGSATFVWNSEPNAVYLVEYLPNGPGEWQVITNSHASQGLETEYTQDGVPEDTHARIYRVRDVTPTPR